MINGARGGIVVKALRHKPAGRGFDSWWCHWNLGPLLFVAYINDISMNIDSTIRLFISYKGFGQHNN
jgi:hypothetical protein